MSSLSSRPRFAGRALALCACWAGLSSFACSGQTESPAPEIVRFVPSAERVAPGGSVELRYEVRFASAVSIDAEPGTALLEDDPLLTGSVLAGPLTESTVFTLTARGPGGARSARVEVSVQTGGAVAIRNFQVTPNRVGPGESAELSWSVDFARSLRIDDLDGRSILAATSTQSSGRLRVRPSADTTYRLTAEGDGGPVSEDVVLALDAAPVIDRFVAEPEEVELGASAELVYTVRRADRVVIRAADGASIYESEALSGRVSVRPEVGARYELRAERAGAESATRTVMIVVRSDEPSGPRINLFSADPPQVALGEPVLLRWNVSGPAALSLLENGAVIAEALPLEGEREVLALSDSTYLLVASHPTRPESRASVQVEVDDSLPGILEFGARPAYVAPGGATTLYWRTVGAERVTVYAGDTFAFEARAGAGEGAQIVAVGTATGSVAYRLVARRAGANAERTIAVEVAEPPTIGRFEVSPALFSDTATLAEVAWSVDGAGPIALYANGVQVPAFPGSASGSIAVLISSTTEFELRAGSATRRAIARQVLDATPPVSGSTVTLTYPVDGRAVRGRIGASGETHAYALTVPEGALLSVRTTGPRGGPCLAPLSLAVRGSTAADALAEATGSAADGCAVLLAAELPALRGVAAGQYLITLSAPAPVEYLLAVELVLPGCGNGILETNELCDDQNRTAGDGCSDRCQLEPVARIVRPGAHAIDGVVYPGQPVYVRLELSAPAYFSAQVETSAADCAWPAEAAPLNFVLLDAALNPLFEAASDEGCPRLGAGPGESLAPGQYFLRFGTSAPAALPYRLRVDLTAQGCGNGVVEVSLGESCDDGNVVAGDGCDGLCLPEAAQEREPNDSRERASGLLDGDRVEGALYAADRDFYRIELATGGALDLRVSVDQRERCALPGPRAGLRLYDQDGRVLVENQRSGYDGRCGAIRPATTTVAAHLPAGSYWVEVLPGNTRGGVGRYLLEHRVRGAGCGDGWVDAELGEECDDGNAALADGCDASCRIEVVTEFRLPSGGVQTRSGQITDVDMIRLVVESPVSLRGTLRETQTSSSCAGWFLTAGVFRSEGLALAEFTDAPSGCSVLDPVRQTEARLEPGVYWLALETFLSGTAYYLELEGVVPACGNGIWETGEECDAGAGNGGGICRTNCRLDAARVLDLSRPQMVSGSVPEDGVARFWVELPVAGQLLSQSYLPSAPDCQDDSVLKLYAADGRLLGENDDNFGTALASCAAFGPQLEFNELPAGRYLVELTGFGGQALPEFELSFELAPLCGNGRVNGTEQCDDSNRVPGDGCAADCRAEAAFRFAPGGGRLTFTATPEQAAFTTMIEVPVGRTLSLSTELASGGCAARTGIVLLDPSGAAIAVAQGTTGSPCAVLTATAEPALSDLVGGQYTVFFGAVDPLSGPVELSLAATIADPACGNGLYERRSGEQCDDGNLGSGDGCDASCVAEAPWLELEPNSTPAEAETIGVARQVGGELSAMDQDYFWFEVPAGVSMLDLEPSSSRFESLCDVDASLMLYDELGALIADGTNAPFSFCGELLAVPVPGPGRYLLQVASGSPLDSSFDYFLRIGMR